MSRSDNGWSTQCEINHINWLVGGIGRPKSIAEQDSQELLKKYLSSMKHRVVWEAIDQVVVKKYVKKLLRGGRKGREICPMCGQSVE